MLEILLIMLLQAAPAQSDYPIRALREGREGVTEFGVRTDQTGKVIQCWIIRSSGSPDLDHATCARAQKMRVSPPVDDKGQPQPAVFKSKMEWKLDGSGSTATP